MEFIGLRVCRVGVFSAFWVWGFGIAGAALIDVHGL